MELVTKTSKALLGLALSGALFAACSKEAMSPLNHSEEDFASAYTDAEISNDSLVLVQLYRQTKGEQWWKKGGWLNDPLEHWRGVKVETIDGRKRVVELRLGAFNLQGTIPAALGKLSELRVLDLKWNERLTGVIPEELYNLSKLRVLNLRMTGITGGLSAKIGQLTEMDTLNLRTFAFEQNVYPYVRNTVLMTGELPKEIGNLRKMRYLDLGRQGFSGTLPSEIGNCVALEDIDLELCRFSGELPSTMRNLKRLHNLSISYNAFEGVFPEWISELKSLKRLWMKYNRFEGSIPESIAQLTNLWDLVLSGNKLSGQLPASMAKMSNLRALSVNRNQLEGDYMTAIAPLLKGVLYDADLSDNNFTGNVPDPAVYSSPVSVRGNRLTGRVPAYYMDRPSALGSIIPQQTGYAFDNITNEEAQRLIPVVKPDSGLIHFPDLHNIPNDELHRR